MRAAAPFAFVLACLAGAALQRDARADDAPGGVSAPGENAPAECAGASCGVRPVRVGAIGGVGFPRVLAVEGMAELFGIVAAGLEYGALPSVTIDGAARASGRSRGDARVFPFRTLGGPFASFFVGVRLGRQHIGANTTVDVPMFGAAHEVLGIDSWYVNPRVGFLWTLPQAAGLTFGFDAGLQVPWGVTTSSTLPLSVAPGGQAAQEAVKTLGNTVLPTVDLLRVGVLL